MHHRAALTLILMSLVIPPVSAQYWSAQAGMGYGGKNRVIPQKFIRVGVAKMYSPMWLFGFARSFGDSSIHARVGLEWERQTWKEDFRYGGLYEGSGADEERIGELTARIDVLRATPQVIVPTSKGFNLFAGLDLGVVVRAIMHETGERRFPWASSWQALDTTYSGTPNMNLYQWSVRVGCEKSIGHHWFISAMFSMGNSTYRPPTGNPDGLTPVFGRLCVGRRF